MAQQQTISSPVTLDGVGLHTGAPASMRICPAPTDHGIVFLAETVEASRNPLPAHIKHVVATELRTELCNAQGASIATVEHFLAACRGLEINNLLVEVDGPEVPILDGSAKQFCEALRASGLSVQAAPRRVLRVLKAVEVFEGMARAKLEPTDENVLSVAGEIDFPDGAIGRQACHVVLTEGQFEAELGFARTFGFAQDIEALQARGLALAGAPIIWAYDAMRPGHALNAALVRAFLGDPAAWCWDEL